MTNPPQAPIYLLTLNTQQVPSSLAVITADSSEVATKSNIEEKNRIVSKVR